MDVLYVMHAQQTKMEPSLKLMKIGSTYVWIPFHKNGVLKHDVLSKNMWEKDLNVSMF